MPFSFRKSKKLSPLRLTASKRGISPSVSVGPVTVGRRGPSVRLGGGLTWRPRRGR